MVIMTIGRWWQRSEAAEGRWGSLTKCVVTKLVTVRRGYDGPSCKPSTDLCAYDGPSYLPSRGMKRAAEEIAKYGTTETTTVHYDHNGPSLVPSTQPRFGRFPANRVLV
ncbi:hypothetical protein EJD97_014599 [Solanum chilense]|uniref:Uncharacterized protein n=1 Tax=Solanum chilense TaxID=4083 RepID=A0A6N2CF53_SOLCI|nr:hypothetical protein EJD97_014599 [Solanum chilense]